MQKTVRNLYQLLGEAGISSFPPVLLRHATNENVSGVRENFTLRPVIEPAVDPFRLIKTNVYGLLQPLPF